MFCQQISNTNITQNCELYNIFMVHDDPKTNEPTVPSSEAKPLELDQGLCILARLIARKHLEHQGSKPEGGQRINYGDDTQQ